MNQIRVLIADDHAVFREALPLLLEQEGDIKVVGEATDGNQALSISVEEANGADEPVGVVACSVKLDGPKVNVLRALRGAHPYASFKEAGGIASVKVVDLVMEDPRAR